ncbi:MAG: hypothetical protein KatS3mg095_0147 [Candidatus Parcubacteria bacterium]|nr:MAG: hypothetical protein KatS3mg095_0147 [Candidatus Parcubacteria bacterium]
MYDKYKKIGFTLIELIVVLAIIATLAAILIVVIKPQQIFINMRDTRRIADLNNLNRAIDLYISDMTNRGLDIILVPSGTILTIGGTINSYNGACNGGSTSSIFYSTANVGGTVSGFNGARATSSTLVSTSTDANPLGWLPVPLGTSTLVNLPNLPIDPRNANSANSANSFYYTFACKTDGSYELNANLESRTNDEQNDGGNNPYLYEVGTDKNLLPGSTSTHFYPGT